MSAIVEIGLETLAHLEAVVVGNGNIAKIKQPMNVGS